MKVIPQFLKPSYHDEHRSFKAPFMAHVNLHVLCTTTVNASTTSKHECVHIFSQKRGVNQMKIKFLKSWIYNNILINASIHLNNPDESLIRAISFRIKSFGFIAVSIIFICHAASSRCYYGVLKFLAC